MYASKAKPLHREVQGRFFAILYGKRLTASVTSHSMLAQDSYIVV